MKYDLKISDYFKDMKSNFRLVVGSDVIIQALSESRLLEADRVTHGMLRALRASGAELILTDHVVEEIYTHIVAANEEYLNHYAEQDKYMSMEVARQSDRILIRAYFYSKLSPPSETMRVPNWGRFLGQFLPYTEVRTAEARIALRTYLREKFGLRSATRDEVDEAIDQEKKKRLSRRLVHDGIKGRKDLAENDTSLVLFVYALREEGREVVKSSVVGYRTWWLTGETRVQRGFEDIISKNGKVIMRPQIAMQLLSFAPNADEVERAFGAIMPSLVGVRLGNRVNPAILRSMLDKVVEVSGEDPARMKAEMERLANRFKADDKAKVEKMLEPI
jgi:hypothetical protein